MPAGAAIAPRAAPAVIITTLALLLGIQPVTTDLYLPALPALTRDLGAPLSGAQLTLTALLLAFGVAQLAAGPLADRLGRRPVLLGGLALYVAASVGAALAPDIAALVAWRAVQGAGMACAVVCARAMVRDLFEPHEGAQVMSRALSGLGVIALASPAIGGLVAGTLGWRAALALLGVFGAVALAMVALAMPETLRQRNPAATRLGPALRTYSRIAVHPTFIAWTLLTTATYAGLFTFLAGSSFVFIEVLGVSRLTCGLLIATNAVAYLLGTVWCRRWLTRFGLVGAVQRGAGFSLGGGVLMAALALAGVLHPMAIMVPQWLYSFGHGVLQPCGQTGMAGPFPAQAGAASALSGFVLACGAFGIGAWLGVAMDGTVLPMTLTLGAMGALTAAIAWTLVRRHGAPAAP